MESEVQPAPSNPSAMLASLVSKRKKLQEELRSIEKQVYELETSYLHDSSQCGNVLKGFEGFLSSSKSTTNLKRSRKFQPEDRLFSLSSVTSPAVEEHAVGRDDGRADFGPGRSKGGGTPANGQGKPKKGRTVPRDGKRIRPSSEQELDDEDDPDLSLR
ncbi:chromatin modification-related protein eaf6 isoform X3 [Magnolia sinica]|uniref:chromatin modification-related protein eaf6 isoform X3 n=1 Tax=Magnolia sinica TaxID=86752 RepID=UPI00265833F9|nr:chromatin modification-related protein eaf6 isoform X3 [Magnolia sinica]